MNNRVIYFLAIIPAEPLRAKLNALKEEFSKSYHTYHGLKSPPHITLIPPFSLENKLEKALLRSLAEFAGSCTAFEVSILDYGAFKRRVIYLNIKKNDVLETLHKKLTEKCNTEFGSNIHLGKPYNPHITLAFRDLSPQMFYKAWKKYEFESFEANFMANSLFLLKHNGKFWDIARELPFALPSGGINDS
jgi:2'-5' RNA ligase